jgi:hypothetical protein
VVVDLEGSIPDSTSVTTETRAISELRDLNDLDYRVLRWMTAIGRQSGDCRGSTFDANVDIRKHWQDKELTIFWNNSPSLDPEGTIQVDVFRPKHRFNEDGDPVIQLDAKTIESEDIGDHLVTSTDRGSDRLILGSEVSSFLERSKVKLPKFVRYPTLETFTVKSFLTLTCRIT